jgi:hypothetical protein
VARALPGSGHPGMLGHRDSRPAPGQAGRNVGEQALLLRPPPAAPRAGRRPQLSDDGRGLSSRRARRLTPAQRRAGRHTTVDEHLPKAHQQHLEWSGAPDPRLGRASRGAHAGSGPRRSSPSGRTQNRATARASGSCAGTPLWGGACRRDPQARPGSRPAVPATDPAFPEAEAHEHVRGPAYYHTMSGENTMLISPTLEKLRAMKSGAMANAWAAH